MPEPEAPMLANIVEGFPGPPSLLSVALRCVQWQVASAVRIPVIGIGGICCVDDIIEFFALRSAGRANWHRHLMHPRRFLELAANLPACGPLKNTASLLLPMPRGKIELPQ